MLFNKINPSESNILNSGLNFAMEFGESWLKPIHERLLKKYGFLNACQLDTYDSICRTAIETGHKFIYDTLSASDTKKGTLTERQLKESIGNFMLNQYPWINKRNLTKLYSQGRYYAIKMD